MLDIKIRAAQPSDINTIAHLLEQLGYSTSKHNLLLVLNDKPAHEEVYIALLDNKVVALMTLVYFTYFPTAEKYCRITTLVVEEKLRGWGIGAQLVNYSKQQALSKKCKAIELTTSLKRNDAQAFYEHLGFQKVSYKYVLPLADQVL